LGEVTSQQFMNSMLWGNTSYFVKFGGEDLSRYSNKIKTVGARKRPYYHCLILTK